MKKASKKKKVVEAPITIADLPVPKKYTPPKAHPTFVKMWEVLIDEVTSRENFKKGHLYQLEILCDLYVEVDKLTSALEISGYTYETSGGRNGDQYKMYPEVAQLNRARAEIRNYSKHLGLLLFKDTDTRDQSEAVDAWA